VTFNSDPPGRDRDAAIAELIQELRSTRFFGCCTNGCKTDAPTCQRCKFIARIIIALRTVEQETHPEVCICAAIQLTDGRIFRGHRHDDCIQTALKQKGEPVEPRLAQQGFMTSRNRFVGREEAMRLQVAAGIESRDGYRGDILFSEDLY
jgi:hypothetical protein